jgi:hypothetical protein
MNRQDVEQLQQMSGYPALTITLPTHRTAPDNQQDPIRLRNLVAQATERLLGEFSKREVAPLLDRLHALAEGVNYRHTLDGMVLFASQDFGARYELPFTLPERVVVGETFLTRDLVFALNRTQRYWVLVLSEQPSRLYEGTRDALVEVHAGGFPMTHEGPGGETSLPGGFGVNISAIRDERHRQFFRAVDEALKPFLAHDPLPLVVVGVDRLLAFFDEVTTHKAAELARVLGSHDKASPAELVKLVWPPVEAALAEQRQKYLVDLDRAIGERKVASTLGEVWRMAHEGRGRLLLVEEEYHTSGKLDETGIHLSVVDDPTAPGVIDDAVDEVIETVLNKQWRVVFTPNGALEQHQRIALVLRY